MNSGKQLMTDMYVSSFEDMLYQLTGYNGGVKFVGYPSEDGTSNHTFQIDGSIAISSTWRGQDRGVELHEAVPE